ncbi:serine hydrolase domain-containing protein [Lactobacillus psittaci]|uniref:Beta-lactamase n=1 Tax=Lactobacillus psittaci DSM 15354 TaxID=1122152 RepID=A0A0R1S1F5_9LACO|nr:serine hydrolase domain-containing protein [Lactobacillus psittaci]KRL63005.1 beta-lactamase [Lactobacillus psittaci DSM 15354]
MRQSLNKLAFHGSVLVIKNGKVAMNYATANKTDTSYLINSVQKFMTATLVMRAVQDGKMSLNDKVAKYYPNIPGGNKVTIANLLQMTSGLTLKDKVKLGTVPFVSDAKNFKYAVANTQFDSKMLGKSFYSTLNYVLLSGIVAKVNHTSYEKLVEKYFIKRLKLKHTAFVWSKARILANINFVSGYSVGSNGKVNKTKLDLNEIHGELGAGSLAMSNQDLYKVLKDALSGNILTEQSRQIIFKGNPPGFYNGGFYNNSSFKGANGASDGYYTFVRTSNDGQDAIIVQSNYQTGNFYKLRAEMNKLTPLIIG